MADAIKDEREALTVNRIAPKKTTQKGLPFFSNFEILATLETHEN